MKLNRRNVLIGLGGIAAGAGTLAGTGAFTSVTATRDVNVSIADDADALLAILPVADSNNSNKYVNDSDQTLAVDVGNVNQNAVTEINRLFKIVNQGTQSVSVWINDDSDAVTFRVDDDSLEGESNAVDLSVGSQVIVDMTVDTTSDEPDNLLSTVEIRADVSDPAPNQGAPTPQYVVDNTASQDDNAFTSIYTAYQAAEPGALIEIQNTGSPYNIAEELTEAESDAFLVEKNNLTFRGVPDSSGARPELVNDSISTGDITSGDPNGLFQLQASGVELQGLAFTTLGDSLGLGDAGNGDQTPYEIDVRAPDCVVENCKVRREGTSVATNDNYGLPGLYGGQVSSFTFLSNVLENCAIGADKCGQATIVGNSIDSPPTEGIFLYSSDGTTIPGGEYVVRGNLVTNRDQFGAGTTALAVGDLGGSIAGELNGETTADGQLESLLNENEVVSATTYAKAGFTVDTSGDGVYSTIQGGVDNEGADTLLLVKDGEYDPFSTAGASGTPGPSNLTIVSEAGARPTISKHTEGGRIVDLDGSDGRFAGFNVVGPASYGSPFGTGIFTGGSGEDPTGILIENVTVQRTDTPVFLQGQDHTLRHSVIRENNFSIVASDFKNDAQSGSTSQPGNHIIEYVQFGRGQDDCLGGDGSGIVSRNNNYGSAGYINAAFGLNVTTTNDWWGDNNGPRTSGENSQLKDEQSEFSDPPNANFNGSITLADFATAKIEDAGLSD